MSPLTLLTLLPQFLSAVPADDDVVAGWTAFAVFGALGLGVVVIGILLTRSLKNVERAAEEGLYDPSDPAKGPARGLAAAREMRARAAAEDAGESDDT